MASHPDARIRGVFPLSDPEPLTIELIRFERSDNPDYAFNDPGEPGRRATTAQCGHCHRTTNDQWVASVHASSASNPVVQDLYAGTSGTLASATDCANAGGRWVEGLEPGTRQPRFRCYLGDGFLPERNPDCRDTSCDDRAAEVGNCADCHAPGIDGVLGGRGLLEATGIAFDHGVHCDVCHRVESIDLAAAPGAAGRLRLLRPTEPASPAIGSGGWRPLTFGPSPDSPNIRMGSVQRDHFRKSEFCAGCHELRQSDFTDGRVPDAARWPTGSIPVQTTFSEWMAGPLSTSAPCQSCHMPPDAEAGNHGDIQIYADPIIGIVAGWFRPAGSMRKHTWPGPRQPGSRMLALAAALQISKQIAADRVVARVTVKNVGAGHAIPTGEPLRHLLLTVRAECDGTPLSPIGGAAVPDYGGYRQQKQSGDDWAVWPGAQVGDRIRVIDQPGDYVDYRGVDPFADDRWTPEQRGLLREVYRGESIVVGVTGDRVTLDAPLPAGARAYLVRSEDDWAGRPGFGFARVLAAADGRRMVPHFAALDVVSDNRLMPQTEWTSEHTFAATCADPIVHAELAYRRYPVRLAREKRWSLQTQPMTEARR